MPQTLVLHCNFEKYLPTEKLTQQLQIPNGVGAIGVRGMKLVGYQVHFNNIGVAGEVPDHIIVKIRPDILGKQIITAGPRNILGLAPNEYQNSTGIPLPIQGQSTVHFNVNIPFRSSSRLHGNIDVELFYFDPRNEGQNGTGRIIPMTKGMHNNQAVLLEHVMLIFQLDD